MSSIFLQTLLDMRRIDGCKRGKFICACSSQKRYLLRNPTWRIRALEAEYQRISEAMHAEGRKNELAFLSQLSPSDQITYFRRQYLVPVPAPPLVMPR